MARSDHQQTPNKEFGELHFNLCGTYSFFIVFVMNRILPFPVSPPHLRWYHVRVNTIGLDNITFLKNFAWFAVFLSFVLAKVF
jgi:hypothetical protein